MIWQHPSWVALIAAAFALVEGSLSEYWVHRCMHRRGWARRRHGEHHMAGTGQGWFGEFRDYVSPALPFCVLSFIPSLAIGIGFSAGVIGYFAFAAYSHQVQHQRPELVFWMKAPVEIPMAGFGVTKGEVSYMSPTSVCEKSPGVGVAGPSPI